MKLKSNLIFSLYTIYGILLKGEPGTSGAYVSLCLCVCVIMCVYTHVAGQQQGRMMKGQNTRSYAGRGRGRGFSFSCTFSLTLIVPAQVCTCVECACVSLLMCVMRWESVPCDIREILDINVQERGESYLRNCVLWTRPEHVCEVVHKHTCRLVRLMWLWSRVMPLRRHTSPNNQHRGWVWLAALGWVTGNILRTELLGAADYGNIKRLHTHAQHFRSSIFSSFLLRFWLVFLMCRCGGCGQCAQSIPLCRVRLKYDCCQ